MKYCTEPPVVIACVRLHASEDAAWVVCDNLMQMYVHGGSFAFA